MAAQELPIQLQAHQHFMLVVAAVVVGLLVARVVAAVLAAGLELLSLAQVILVVVAAGRITVTQEVLQQVVDLALQSLNTKAHQNL
jgi:hypothetical protein